MFGNRKPDLDQIKKLLDNFVSEDHSELRFTDLPATISDTGKGDVLITVTIQPEEYQAYQSVTDPLIAHIKASVKGVQSVRVIYTADKQPAEQAPKTVPTQEAPKQAKPANPLENVELVIAVSSGKGGVGKSTVTSNLAAALMRKGRRVGILDADIYGPSIPLMFGCEGQKPDVLEQRFIPIVGSHNVPLMSSGFIVPGVEPLVWRGPMVHKALIQMMNDVHWDKTEIDTLLIDMPPGTGDVALTLAKHAPITGAVIVSTPQAVALADVRKGIEMYRKLGTPIYGVVENMADFHCPSCGHVSNIFGLSGAEEEANKMEIPFLGRLSLFPETRQCADEGEPIVFAKPDHDATGQYLELAHHILQKAKSALSA